jgi:signal transduction histidine kinase
VGDVNDHPLIRWLPGVFAGLAVLVSGVLEYLTEDWLAYPGRRFLFALVILGTAVAVALIRTAPAFALGLAWLIPICQIVTRTPLVITQVAVLAIAFGAARWGSRVTVWAAGLSIPVGAAVAVVLINARVVRANLPVMSYELILGSVNQIGFSWRIGLTFVLLTMLGTPWLAGLALRAADRARAEAELASIERARAEETARIRDAQTRLARDVHDVVGHSLAVILAQAESGRYLPDDNPAALKSALATIATSARTSLRDVREVLSATRDTAGDDLEKLIENLRNGGHEVVSELDGSPRPLDEPQRTTAYRVLQEMLTNAIRHGRRGSAVIVRRAWDGDGLVVEVRNAVDDGPPGTGSGLAGMRDRLAAVGGTLETGRREDVFVATARIPVT